MADPEPALRLAVQYASAAATLPSRAQLRRWVRAAVEHPMELTVRIVDAEEAQSLNSDFRQKGYVPNVLSFEYGTVDTDDARAEVLGGDVVICAPVVAQEAREQGKSLMHHYAHMVVHGVLHVQGYDHIHAADADIMESREAAILKRFRIPNPYLS